MQTSESCLNDKCEQVDGRPNISSRGRAQFLLSDVAAMPKTTGDLRSRRPVAARLQPMAEKQVVSRVVRQQVSSPE